MSKKRLGEVSKKVYVHIMLNGPIVSTKLGISEQLNIEAKSVGKALVELSYKRWIKKKLCGQRGLRLENRKSVIPQYIIEEAELYLQKYVC